MSHETKLAEIEAARTTFIAANPGHDPLTTLLMFNLLAALSRDVMRPDDPTTADVNEERMTFDVDSFLVTPVGEDRALMAVHINLPTMAGNRRSYLALIMPESLVP